MTVYLLYRIEEDFETHHVLIGVYSTLEKAERAREQARRISAEPLEIQDTEIDTP